MKKTQIIAFLGIGTSLLIPATAANAHFLWGSVTGGTEPTYRLAISESPAEGNDADHVEQARDSKAWPVGGRDLKLTEKDNFLTAPLDASAKVIAAGYSWGVFASRNKDKSIKHWYLLDLYAKTAVTEAAAAESANLPLEVFARRDGKNFVATVKVNDKALAKAEVVVVSPDSKEEKTFRTDSKGSVRFPYSTAGLYTVRAINVETPGKGALNGKRYTMVHGYSTLTFTAR